MASSLMSTPVANPAPGLDPVDPYRRSWPQVLAALDSDHPSRISAPFDSVRPSRISEPPVRFRPPLSQILVLGAILATATILITPVADAGLSWPLRFCAHPVADPGPRLQSDDPSGSYWPQAAI